ncbi:Threonine-phosphate decarboxylase [Pannonibacter phragmitetus]|uniref:threonine-phosphate decarboxylase n=1 Tax=Pannonibacter phragmitetus TaxID=121719 RepID=A0A378ZTM4_9HYPH|nr:threonine-phosphate decarboxylase CobD [Pannonibacter phragmitetus]SUB00612.1 Threonine-phosphate decarboxylase [Pannonibacter phragmitetus]
MKHGGDLFQATSTYGGAEEDWLDLSTGINPHAYPVPASLPASAWSRLPAHAAQESLLKAARAAYQVPAHLGLAAAPGTQVILPHLPALLPEGGVTIAGPTYSSHGDAWRAAGRQVSETSDIFRAGPEDRIALIVSPNNPDGRWHEPQALLKLAGDMQQRGGFLVVDEAFADVDPSRSLLPHLMDEPVLVLRSFGKFFGLAGLRLGFLAGPRNVTDALARRLESWSVSGPALKVGTQALRDLDWQAAMRKKLAQEMASLEDVLRAAGLAIRGGTSLYVLAEHPGAARLHQALAQRRIWVRAFDYAPSWLRFGLPGSPEGLARLRQALTEAMASHDEATPC